MMKNQREIARKLNLSQMTVSRALHNSPLVSQATKARVMNEVRTSGYSLNTNARNLHLNKFGTVGILTPGVASMETMYFSGAFPGICSEINTNHYNLLLMNIERQADIEGTLIPLIRRIDGMIVFNIGTMRTFLDKVIKRLRTFNVKHILIQSFHDRKHKNYLTVDNVDGGRKATEYLIRLGHRRIVFMGAGPSLHECEERAEGYAHALRDNGILHDHDLVLRGFVESDVEKLRTLFMRKKAPTAIFAWSDHYARVALYELRLLGKNVPGDVSIVGFDDSPCHVFMSHPHLTTIRQPLYKIGQDAVRYILRDQPIPESNAYEAELMARESCRKINPGEQR